MKYNSGCISIAYKKYGVKGYIRFGWWGKLQSENVFIQYMQRGRSSLKPRLIALLSLRILVTSMNATLTWMIPMVMFTCHCGK